MSVAFLRACSANLASSGVVGKSAWSCFRVDWTWLHPLLVGSARRARWKGATSSLAGAAWRGSAALPNGLILCRRVRKIAGQNLNLQVFTAARRGCLETTAPCLYLRRRAISARRRLLWHSLAIRFRSCRHADHWRISASSQRRTSSRWTSRARTSGTVISGSFFPQPLPLQHQERQRQQRQRRVVMPAYPAPRLILVQSTFPFARLDVSPRSSTPLPRT